MVHHDISARNARLLGVRRLVGALADCDLSQSPALEAPYNFERLLVSSVASSRHGPSADKAAHSKWYNPAMPTNLDVANWGRRDLFNFFVNFDNPYFNICTQLDITKLLESLRRRPQTSVSLAFHYFALRAANEIEPFRYRLRDGKVLVYEVIHGGTIVLLPNESFNFAYFNYYDDFGRFMAEGQQSIAEVQKGDKPFNPDPSGDRIHFTVLPWATFTSFAHARNWGREDSIPKVAFGKFTTENDKTLLPISVEVHHALMDGLHVGRYFSRMQEMMDAPEIYVQFGA